MSEVKTKMCVRCGIGYGENGHNCLASDTEVDLRTENARLKGLLVDAMEFASHVVAEFVRCNYGRFDSPEKIYKRAKQILKELEGRDGTNN